MRITIENEILKAELESFGAELKSLVSKKDSQEYMWEADPAFWGKTSPILFPFIGKLEKQGVTKVALVDKEGAEYVRVEAESCPVWGVWSMPTSDASYVCIEPWWGVNDNYDKKSDLSEKRAIMTLKAGENASFNWNVEISE